jgi:hypothetical protein
MVSAKSKYGKSELEALWIKEGGPKAEAKIAAAIALAESGGVPTAKNPEGPEHAEGLWQIKGQDVAGNPFNPEVSAANAVAKWRAAGGFTPWTTFTSGAYKQYLGGESGGGGFLGNFLPGPNEGIGEFLGTFGQGENIKKTITEPVREATKEAEEGIDAVPKFLKAITTPSTWLRLAEGLGGIVLFMIGLKTLTKGTPTAGAANVAIGQIRSVKGVAVKGRAPIAKLQADLKASQAK